MSVSEMKNANPRAGLVLGYYPSWKPATAPDAIRFESFTHLAHAFAGADQSGNVVTSSATVPSRQLTTLAHEHGVKVLLSLGGAESGPVFSAMLKDEAARQRYVQGICSMLDEYGYDGIDVDWEFPKDAADRANLTELCRSFRASFERRSSQFLISAGVPGVESSGQWFDHQGLQPLLDFVNVMTYDMHGPWSSHAGHNAPLLRPAADEALGERLSFVDYMDYWERVGWPKRQLLVGIPCYGRGFRAAEWHAPTTGEAEHPAVEHRHIQSFLDAGWQRHWDAEAQVPYLVKEGALELISYEDEASAELKGRWARQSGYAGIFFWEITQDLADGEHRIVAAAQNGFFSERD
jgi:chitinase